MQKQVGASFRDQLQGLQTEYSWPEHDVDLSLIETDAEANLAEKSSKLRSLQREPVKLFGCLCLCVCVCCMWCFLDIREK